MSDWLTIEELAKQEGITIDGARKRAQRGQYATKKDGRRTLYRIFTAEQAEAAAEEKKEVSAQSAFLAAKAEKMQLDAERAKVKLHQEKMLLYDDVYLDETSANRLFCTLLKDGAREILKPEQYEAYKKMIEKVYTEFKERYDELRKDYADQLKSTPEILREYSEYANKRYADEKAAEKEREAKQRADISLAELELIRRPFGGDIYCKHYVKIKNASMLSPKATAALLEDFKKDWNELEKAYFKEKDAAFDTASITTEAKLMSLINKYKQKISAIDAEYIKKGE
jgi:hypothetical protein